MPSTSAVTPRLISLKIAATDVSDQISRAFISSAEGESDFLTFAAARSGGNRDYTLALTIVQDHAVGTLWDTVWTGAGTEVAGVYAPYGNPTPSATQPHYTFTAIVSEPDGEFLGAEADASVTAVATVEVEWKLKAKPVKKITA